MASARYSITGYQPSAYLSLSSLMQFLHQATSPTVEISLHLFPSATRVFSGGSNPVFPGLPKMDTYCVLHLLEELPLTHCGPSLHW